MTYNGWSNRPTWLVNVWFNPECKQDIDGIRFHFNETINSIKEPWLRDFIDESVNWEELENHFEDEEE